MKVPDIIVLIKQHLYNGLNNIKILGSLFLTEKESTRKYNKTKIVRIDGNLIFPERACTIDKKSGYIPIQI